LGAAGVAAAASLAMSSAALADDAPKFGYSITITATSDYIFRGISLTDSSPAFQPFIEFTYGTSALTWYLDFWGSNVNDQLGDPLEVDVYAGVRPVTGPVSWDIGVLWYTNPTTNHHSPAGDGLASNPFGLNTNYVEFKVAASVTPVTNLTLTAIGYATPDVGFASPVTETGEFDAAYVLPQMGIFVPTLSGAVGITNAERASTFDAFCDAPTNVGPCNIGTDNYWYWNAGVKLAADKFFIDLRYWDTSISHTDDALSDASARFVGSFGVNLP